MTEKKQRTMADTITALISIIENFSRHFGNKAIARSPTDGFKHQMAVETFKLCQQTLTDALRSKEDHLHNDSFVASGLAHRARMLLEVVVTLYALLDIADEKTAEEYIRDKYNFLKFLSEQGGGSKIPEAIKKKFTKENGKPKNRRDIEKSYFNGEDMDSLIKKYMADKTGNLAADSLYRLLSEAIHGAVYLFLNNTHIVNRHVTYKDSKIVQKIKLYSLGMIIHLFEKMLDIMSDLEIEIDGYDTTNDYKKKCSDIIKNA